jgi:SAM-dependent methyltransferase
LSVSGSTVGVAYEGKAAVESSRRPTGWQSYDSVAEAYERAAVPRFALLARDLVAAVSPALDAIVLDVGTGTGVTGSIALESLGSTGLVVGIDPSINMLRRARASGGFARVAALAPGLPLPDAVIDVVTANLVLSHLPSYEEGLADLTRVLRNRGRLGLSAWGPQESPNADDSASRADDHFDSLLRAHGLDVAPPSAAVPWEDRFRERGNLVDALSGADLVDINVQQQTYRWSLSIEEYLGGREWPPRMRYAREQAGDQLWEEIRDRAASELLERFGDAIQSIRHVWIATATKP